MIFKTIDDIQRENIPIEHLFKAGGKQINQRKQTTKKISRIKPFPRTHRLRFLNAIFQDQGAQVKFNVVLLMDSVSQEFKQDTVENGSI